MKRIIPILLLVSSITNGFAQSFTPGNFVVLRIGSGAEPLTAGVAQPVFLDEYNSCGDLVRSLPMPVSVNGTNKRLTLPISTSDYTEGYLSLSQDGLKLGLVGYDADPGTANVSATTTTAVKRVAAIVDKDGNVNTTTALSAFSSQVIRAAVIDGANIWVTGGSGGVMHTTLGGTTHTQLTTTTARALMVISGQLYASSTSGSLRLTAVGSGLPTTTGQTMVNLPGLPATGSPYQFFIINPNSGSDVLYIADDNLLRKYSLSGGTWVGKGTIGIASDKYRAVTGKLTTGGHVLLYAIRRNDNTTAAGGEIVTLIDSTGNSGSITGLTPKVIARSNDYTVFRSIMMAPDASLATDATALVENATISEEADSQNIKLTPNAAREKVLISFDQQKLPNATIVLTNASGQVLRKMEPASTTTGQVTIIVKGLTKGVYYVTINSGNKHETKKLLVL